MRLQRRRTRGRACARRWPPTTPCCRGRSRPLGKAIGSQVANQIPALSTSAGYTYEWNPELEVLERSAETFGPLFTERAVTRRPRQVQHQRRRTPTSSSTEFNGKNLDKLTNRVERAFVPETGHDRVLRSLPALSGRRRSRNMHAPGRRSGPPEPRPRGPALRLQLHLRRCSTTSTSTSTSRCC